MSKRDEYVEKLKVKLDEWNTDLDKLEARAEHVKEDLRALLLIPSPSGRGY